jgi:hypothetical protein
MRLRLARRALGDAKRKKRQRVEQRGGDVWVHRLLMAKTRNHVYYAIEETEIVVLAIWGAPTGRGPKL